MDRGRVMKRTRSCWRRWRCVALRTALSVGGLLGLVAGVAALSTRYDGPPFGRATGLGQTYFTLASQLDGAVWSVSLLTIVVWIGWSSRFQRHRFTPLYWGVLVTAVGAAIILPLVGANAFGLIRNDLRQEWGWPTQSETQLLLAVGFRIFIIGLALKVIMFLRGGGLRWRSVAILFSSIAGISVAIQVVAFWG